MNIIIYVSYVSSGIYTNCCIFLCKECEVGYYIINHVFTEEDYVNVCSFSFIITRNY